MRDRDDAVDHIQHYSLCSRVWQLLIMVPVLSKSANDRDTLTSDVHFTSSESNPPHNNKQARTTKLRTQNEIAR